MGGELNIVGVVRFENIEILLTNKTKSRNSWHGKLWTLPRNVRPSHPGTYLEEASTYHVSTTGPNDGLHRISQSKHIATIIESETATHAENIPDTSVE